MLVLKFRRIFLFLLSTAMVMAIFSVAAANNKSPNYFEYKITSLPPNIQKLVKKYVWHPGCPVPLQKLAYVKLSYWGMDHKKHTGFLIINKQLATEIVDIFREIYKARFPIERMEPIPFNTEVATNDTSSFYCRANRSNPDQYSFHAYGSAIDINSLINPYVREGIVLPAEGKRYLDRSKSVPGKIVRGDKVYQIFVKHGWKWGGDFKHVKDYMHFEKDLHIHAPPDGTATR